MIDALMVMWGPDGPLWTGFSGGNDPEHVRDILMSPAVYALSGPTADRILEFLGRAKPAEELRPCPGVLVVAVQRFAAYATET